MAHRSLSWNTPGKSPTGPLSTAAGRAHIFYARSQGLHLINTPESLLFLHLMVEGRGTRGEKDEPNGGNRNSLLRPTNSPSGSAEGQGPTGQPCILLASEGTSRRAAVLTTPESGTDPSCEGGKRDIKHAETGVGDHSARIKVEAEALEG